MKKRSTELIQRIGRKSCFTALALLLAFSLTACHGARTINRFEVPGKLDPSKKIELTFWAKNDTNKTQTEIYKKAVGDFEALYPNVSVAIKLYTNYGDIYNDVITNISTGTTPNVCISYPDHIATYLTGESVVLPLDELISDPGYGLGGSELLFDSPREDELIGKFRDECRINGSTYALPFMRSTEAVYVNRDYVEKLGYELPEILTWDFVFEVSEKAMEKDEDGKFKVNGQDVLIPFLYKSTDNMMIQMLKQEGLEYSTEDGQILLFNEGTRKILETVAEHGKSRAFSTFEISSYPANFLNAGQCIFAVDSTAGSTWMGTDAPLIDIAKEKLVRFNTEVRMVPQVYPEKPQMISQGPSICVFNKDDPEIVLWSWIFAQYLLTNEVQTAYSGTEGYVPVTSKAQNSEAYQDYLSRSGEDAQHYSVKIAASKLILDNVDHTFVTPVFNGSASLRDAAGSLIESTVKSARRKTTIDDAFFDRLFADTQKLYRLDQIGQDGQMRDLGPLPGTALVLLAGILILWIFYGGIFLLRLIWVRGGK